MSTTHHLLKTVRSLHLYFGVFMAPALLFFAFTGGLQAFGLHEGHRGSDYRTPAWLESLAHLHKKQSLLTPAARPAPPPIQQPRAAPDSGQAAARVDPRSPLATASKPAPQRNLLPMKIFFGSVALSLMLSVFSGIYMALRFTRRPLLVASVLTAGVIVPGLLLLI